MNSRNGKNFTTEQKMTRFDSQRGCCASCGRPLDPNNHGGPNQGLKWDAHHRNPIENGGSGATQNCVILCKDCHAAIHYIMNLNHTIRFDTANEIWAYARKLMHTRGMSYERAIEFVMRDAGYLR